MRDRNPQGVMRTRSCGSSSTGCAETSSWILRSFVSIHKAIIIARFQRTGHCDGYVVESVVFVEADERRVRIWESVARLLAETALTITGLARALPPPSGPLELTCTFRES
jgi:hypothetical protein